MCAILPSLGSYGNWLDLIAVSCGVLYHTYFVWIIINLSCLWYNTKLGRKNFEKPVNVKKRLLYTFINYGKLVIDASISSHLVTCQGQ